MDAMLVRDDVPIEVLLHKALKDGAAAKRKMDYLESLGNK